MIAHQGLPAFFHDWTWPLFRDRVLWTWHLQLSAWSPDGIGRPNGVPTINPLAWLKIVLAAALPAESAAKAYLWLSVACATAGIFRLSERTLRVPTGWAAFSTALFAGSPFLFAKIASGQSSEWAAIAAFIWGFSFMLDAFAASSVRMAAAAALLFALATNQLQFLVFSELAALISFAVYRPTRGWIVWSTIAAGSAVFALPSLSFLAGLGPVLGAEVSPPYAAWEYTQSSSLGEAFALLGYASHYPETFLSSLSPWTLDAVRWSMWAIGAAALAGAVVARSRAAAALASIGLVGVLWISGTRGPAAPVWQWAFAHISMSAFLREFYHGAVLVAIPYATLPAAALAWLCRRSVASAYALAISLAGIAGLATWCGGLGSTLPMTSAPPYAPAVRSALPARDGRVLFLPPERPLYIHGDRVGGVDAFDWAGVDQLSLFDYYPDGPLAYAASELDTLHVDVARRILARTGCDAVVWRPDVTSPFFTARPEALSRAWGATQTIDAGALVFPLIAPQIVSGARATAPLPSSLDQMSADPALVYLDIPGADAAMLLPAGLRAPEPGDGWVGYRDLYSAFGDGLSTPTLGAVTTRKDATITVPGASGSMLLFAPSGAVVGDRTIVAQRYERVPISRDTVVRALGVAAIGELGERPRSVAVAPSEVSARRTTPWRYEGTVTLHGRGLVVLRQRYASGWTLSAPGARVIEHDRADGFGNAWLLAGESTTQFTIVYAPQASAFVLLVISLAAAMCLCAVIARTADNKEDR